MKARKLIAMLLVVATLMSFAPMAVFAAEGDTYVVDVQYVYAGGPLDGEHVATPWSGSYAHGSGDNRTISVPTAQGYTAQLAAVPSGVTASLNGKELTFSFENLSANKTIQVEYVPAEVGMTVEFYQESLVEGAEADLVETVTIDEAKTGDDIADYVSYTDGKIIVEGAEKKYSGFYGLWFDNSDTVAADGNTKVKVYFDREYYLLSFDLGGGYGVDPQFLRFGETVETVGTPVRPGYTFEGWYTDAELTTEATVPAKMPADNVKLYAKWTASSADYTVMYWKENANDSNYSFWTYEERQATAGTEVTGSGDKTETGFYFSHADTKTVEGDGTTIINVYYKRNTYTLYFMLKHTHSSSACGLNCTNTSWLHSHKDSCYNCGKSSGDWYAAKEFTGVKYEQNTDALWAQAPAGYKWLVAANSTTFYTNAPGMPNSDLKIYGTSSSGSSTIHYYEKGTTTSIKDDYVVNDTGWSFTSEDYILIPGFTYSSSSKNGNNYYIYYTRNSYSLTFHNANNTIDGGTHLYQADISDEYFVPDMPEGMEANAVTFGGWYTTQDCLDGTEFNFEGATMPVDGLILYAKWAPVTHDVTVYLDADAAKAGTDPISTQKVPHRDFATEPEGVTNDPYAFVAWFYVDEDGNEKAFDFGSMQITRDTVVYAKWKASNPVAYTVKFQLADGTEVAEPINGMALPFTNVTEEAKVGEELYAAYQEGYFPNIASQSIDISGTDVNEIIFIYAPAENVPYTVRYLEEGTGKVLKDEKVVSDNKKSVVTETAAFINGYMADAYQKRLVLTTGEGAENVITFYYTADTENTLVIIEHILDDRNFQEDFSQTPEKKGTVITASAKTIGGYVFDHVDIYYLDGTVIRENVKDATVTETLDLKGLHIVFHYIPNEFYVHHQSDGSVETYKLPEHEAFDVTGVVYDHYLYGGLYDSTFTTPYTSATLAKAYKNAPVDGMNLKPAAGEHYYVKEVDDRYARPGLYLISHTRSQQNYKMLNLYLLTAIDNGNYLEVGVELNGVEHSISSSNHNMVPDTNNTAEETNNWNVLHSVFTVNFEASPGKDAYTDNVTANSLFKVGEGKGYLYAYDYSAYIANPEKVTYSCFFVTPDGVRVEGVKYRDLYKDSTIDGVDILTKNNFVRTASDEIPSVCTSKNTASGTNAVEFAPLMTRSTLAVSAQIVDTYTITSVNGSTTSVQEVEAGDQTGAIAYTEKAGYVFAGWYTNKACTKPADFSNVQSDMTVYPKYISVKNVTSKVMPLGKFMNVSVSVPNSDLTQVGVSYTVDGETTNVVCKKSQNLIVGLKKLLGSKATTYTASWSMSGLANGDTFSVTTYWVTADGTMVEIQTTDYAYSRNRISVQ